SGWILLLFSVLAGCSSAGQATVSRSAPFKAYPVTLDGLFYETAAGRTMLPAVPFEPTPDGLSRQTQTNLPDGRVATISVKSDGNGFSIRMSAQPDQDILKWGLAVAAAPDEHFTGLMERVV